MHPILLQLYGLKLHMYGLSIAIGFLIILNLMQRRGVRHGIKPDDIAELSFGVLFWGVLGTRLLHIIMFSEDYSWSNPLGWIAIWNGGLVFQGAIPAAIIYLVYGLRKRKLPFWGMMDLAAPYVPIAQAFGRMGCFFNGCCYGVPTDMPWGLSFPPASPPAGQYPDAAGSGWSLHIHPTQLYSVILLLSISAIMLYSRERWHPVSGYLLPLYFILYGIKRFIVECFRGDGNPTNLGFGLLSNQQVFCIFSILLGAALFLYLRSRPPKVTWPNGGSEAA